MSDLTIKNTLSKKRKQLPPDRPAMIICWIPNRWRAATARFEGKLEDLARAFLRGTGRVNYLFFAEDIIYHRGNNTGMLTNMLAHVNPKPRHPYEPLQARWQAMGERSAKVRAALKNEPAPRYGGGSGTFDDWLDWLQGRG